MKLAPLVSLGICVSLGAGPAAPPKTSSNTARAAEATQKQNAQPVVTIAQVRGWTKMWQKRLELDDWNITTEMVRLAQLRPNTLGNLHWDNSTKTAIIRVLNPLDYELPVSQIPSDIEFTVVHELIHLQLAALPRDPAGRGVEERVVNRIAEALLGLERGSSYQPRAQMANLPQKDKNNSSEASRSVKP